MTSKFEFAQYVFGCIVAFALLFVVLMSIFDDALPKLIVFALTAFFAPIIGIPIIRHIKKTSARNR